MGMEFFNGDIRLVEVFNQLIGASNGQQSSANAAGDTSAYNSAVEPGLYTSPDQYPGSNNQQSSANAAGDTSAYRTSVEPGPYTSQGQYSAGSVNIINVNPNVNSAAIESAGMTPAEALKLASQYTTIGIDPEYVNPPTSLAFADIVSTGDPEKDQRINQEKTEDENRYWEAVARKAAFGVASLAAERAAASYNAIAQGSSKAVPEAKIASEVPGNADKAPQPTVYALPCTAVGSHAADLTDEQKKANAQYIFNYLTAKGWSKEAISGLLGNIEQESRLNPGVWEVKDNLQNGYGLVQWTAAGDKFLNWANLNADQANEMAKNDPKKLMDLQLEYLQLNIKPGGGEWIPTTKYYSPYKMTDDEFIKSDKDPGDLAKVFHAHFERSGDGKDVIEIRADNARKWYKLFSK